MKRISLVIALALSLLVSPSFADSSVPASFVIDGSGFGHGVGLSQIGAKGQALEGKSALDILSYYFPGTDLNAVDDSANIRVNVGHQLKSATIVADTAFNKKSTFQAIKGKVLLSNVVAAQAPTSLGIFGSDNSLKISIVGKQIRALISGSGIPIPISALSDSLTIRWPGTSPLGRELSGVVVTAAGVGIRLHYGQVQITPVFATGLGYRLEITDSMALHDEYLYGISEVPSSWPGQALEAQVIASRTYALSRMGKVRKECDCQIYSTKYDQSYVGYAKEAEPKFGQLWREAVDLTASDSSHGIAIFYRGKPINVYFFSSSGGSTQRSVDVWGSAFPYLTNVPDPWSLDPTLNPGYAHWERVISQAKMALAFHLPDVLRYEVGARSVSNSVLVITAYSSTGQSSQLSVGDFKTRLLIPSSWFDLPQPTPTPTATPSPTDTSSPTASPSATPLPSDSAIGSNY